MSIVCDKRPPFVPAGRRATVSGTPPKARTVSTPLRASPTREKELPTAASATHMRCATQTSRSGKISPPAVKSGLLAKPPRGSSTKEPSVTLNPAETLQAQPRRTRPRSQTVILDPSSRPQVQGEDGSRRVIAALPVRKAKLNNDQKKEEYGSSSATEPARDVTPQASVQEAAANHTRTPSPPRRRSPQGMRPHTRSRSNTVSARPVIPPAVSSKPSVQTITEEDEHSRMLTTRLAGLALKPAAMPEMRTPQLPVVDENSPPVRPQTERPVIRTRPRSNTVGLRPLLQAPMNASTRPASLGGDASSRSDARGKTEGIEVFQVLGTGTFGEVRLVKRKGLPAAMKVTEKQMVIDAGLPPSRFSEEVTVMKALSGASKDSRYFVSYIDHFQDAKNLYILMDAECGGTLSTLVTRVKPLGGFSSKQVQFFAAEMALGMGYLHSEGVMHRDIKPDNILIASDGHLKYCDFGAATTQAFATDFVGTPEYTAPEILLKRLYGKEVDYYSFGATVYELLTGNVPFPPNDESPDARAAAPFEAIKEMKQLEWPEHIGCVEKDLVEQLMKRSAWQRMGKWAPFGDAEQREPKELMKHTFFDGMDWKNLAPTFRGGVRERGDDGIRYGIADGWDGFSTGLQKNTHEYLFSTFPSVVEKP
ncbi:kinase-like protein [Cylindrobasidium torrendii FP15055 ss-10]|uniref:non-specific serine/threonine protein kinase n=1 Tax=Cylindrobasidium torrendii FP15055 ss-10 TaxID=1314674 RepID=A0A0D7BFF9_9AGAR|nr:kinase-like protein [Cylindrobasidium torrendii FP15055 ss-10]